MPQCLIRLRCTHFLHSLSLRRYYIFISMLFGACKVLRLRWLWCGAAVSGSRCCVRLLPRRVVLWGMRAKGCSCELKKGGCCGNRERGGAGMPCFAGSRAPLMKDESKAPVDSTMGTDSDELRRKGDGKISAFCSGEFYVHVCHCMTHISNSITKYPHDPQDMTGCFLSILLEVVL